MANFLINKESRDSFVYNFCGKIFHENYDFEYEVMLESAYTFYKKSLYKKIEKALSEIGPFKTKTTYQTIDSNNQIVIDERIYISETKDLMLCIKNHFNYDDYPMIEDIVEEDEDSYSKTSNEFQSKIVIFTSNAEDETAKKIFKKIVSKKRRLKKLQRQLSVVCSDPENGTYLKDFQTVKRDISIEDSYNDDFKEVNDFVLKRLCTRGDNGIVLFHSEPGCGKTTYLRYLTQNIKDKKLIYLPPDMINRLADPDFMTFLMTNKDSIIFIEDAENCLQKREQGGNQAVSNLLNNSDGLLGDALRLQIVCTFNCDISQIDPALLRPGRLIAEYKFKKLTKEKSVALATKIYPDKPELVNLVSSDMTLAEVYNLHSKQIKTEKPTNTIGFKRY